MLQGVRHGFGAATTRYDLSIAPEAATCHSTTCTTPWSAATTRSTLTFAMTSSDSEKTHADVLMLGNSTSTTSDMRMGHHAMTTGRFEVFVRGEQNSHQGPPDGNPLALIVRTDP